ncbi:amino acid adenylation domain-containing protein, partial [Candidatus Poribacteria bacterium]
MNTFEFLSHLRKLGAELSIHEGHLQCRDPEGVITQVLRDELAEREQEILEFLRRAELYIRPTLRSIPPAPRDERLPLSFAQQRLWFLDQLAPGVPIYNISKAMRLIGGLNVTALEQTINEIVRRHEALRTRFPSVDGQPVQAIVQDVHIPLQILDLQKFQRPDRESEVHRILSEMARHNFDLSQGPLLMTRLLRLSEDEHIFALVIHHIVSDGWSSNLISRELSALYQAFSSGEQSPLPELPIQYADFAIWQSKWLQGGELNRQLSYWKKQLEGAPSTLELPTDRPRPAVQTFRGASLQLTLSEHICQSLRELGNRENATLFMTLLAALKTLFFRYTGQDDIVVGSVIANRNRVEIEELIGFFVNTLVLRTDVSGDPNFLELLRRVREVCLEAYAHQDMPFEKLVAELRPDRNLSRNPMFQVMMAPQSRVKSGNMELHGLSVEPVAVSDAVAKFDLAVFTSETAQSLKITFEYNTDLFDHSTISRMSEHLQTLLEAIIAHPERRLSELPLLSDSERQQLLVEWNDTQTSYPESLCAHELFEVQAKRKPDAIALVLGGKQLTYRELNHRANQLAHLLQTLGVGPEVIVAVLVDRSLDMVVGILSVLKAGGAYVPIDPTYPEERVAFILRDSEASVLLTQEKLLAGLSDQGVDAICLDRDWRTISQKSQENPISRARIDNLAYAIYTSGSTGRPKGVLIPHRGLLNLIFWHQRVFEVTASDQATQLAGTAFDASVWEIWPYLTTGAMLHLIEPDFLRSPEQLRDWLVSEGITIGFLPTPLAESMLDLTWPENTALRIMLTGGDKLHKYPPSSLPFKLVNNYGPTENTVVTTSGTVAPGGQDGIPPPIGYPIDNIQVYVLDKYLQPVAVGIPGELHISGSGIARGYLNRPELTAEKFIPHPFSNDPEARLYKTGDLVRYLPDGDLEFLGRLDYQVKIRGFRIELGEIEAILSQHPGVQETVTVVRERSSNDKYLMAYIVPDQSQIPTVGELRHFAVKKLPDYMVPSEFMLLDALPLTSHGKIDRRALPEPERSGLEEI